MPTAGPQKKPVKTTMPGAERAVEGGEEHGGNVVDKTTLSPHRNKKKKNPTHKYRKEAKQEVADDSAPPNWLS